MEADPECEAWLAWAAGLIDGEGTLFLSKNGRGAYVRVEMTDARAVTKLHQILGGSLRNYPPRPGGRRHTYVWFRSGSLALSKTLKQIRPWLVTKGPEADVLLDYLTRPLHQGRKDTRSEIAERERVYWKLRELKMSKLTTAARKKLPKKSFAIPSKAPGSGSYPIEDKAHARNALARVSQFGSPAEKAAVRAKVHKKYPSMGKKAK